MEFALSPPDITSRLPPLPRYLQQYASGLAGWGAGRAVSVAVRSMYLSGAIRLNMRPIAEYPFIGNATFSFLTIPALDMGISTFGGVDLSSVPLLHGWVNSSLFYVMRQLTYPNELEFNMGSILCTTCFDEEVIPAPPSHLGAFVMGVKGVTASAQRYIGAVSSGVKDGVKLVRSRLQGQGQGQGEGQGQGQGQGVGVEWDDVLSIAGGL